MKLASPSAPITLSVDGYRCLVMPMAIPETKPKVEADSVVREAEQVAQEAEAKAESKTKTKVEVKHKHRGRVKVKA